MHLALLVVLVILLQWPATRLAADFIQGFRVVGNIPNCGVYGPSEDLVVDESVLLQYSWECALAMRRRTKHPPRFQDPAGSFRTVHRFPVLQASGKIRPCDNGDGGGHTALTCDGNKLSLCTAIQPAVHVRIFTRQVRTSTSTLHLGTTSSSQVGRIGRMPIAVPPFGLLIGCWL